MFFSYYIHFVNGKNLGLCQGKYPRKVFILFILSTYRSKSLDNNNDKISLEWHIHTNYNKYEFRFVYLNKKYVGTLGYQ